MKKDAVKEGRDAPGTIITTTKVRSANACHAKNTHGCRRNGSQWRPKRCSVARGGPSSPASCIVGLNAARSYLADSILKFSSSGNLKEKTTVPPAVPQRSDAGEVFPPVETLNANSELSAGRLHAAHTCDGTEEGADLKLLSVFTPSSLSLIGVAGSQQILCETESNSTHRVSCHLAVPCLSPSSASTQTCERPSFFVHLSAISLASRAHALLYIVSIILLSDIWAFDGC